MNLYLLHGILQAKAFLILFPAGILIAIFRESIGIRWLMYHIVCQVLAALCVFTAVAVMMYAKYLENKNKNQDKNKDQDKKKHDHSGSKESFSYHVYLGFAVVGLIVFQLIWASLLRNSSIIPRPIWLRIHILLAVAILAGGWTNIYLGYIHYR